MVEFGFPVTDINSATFGTVNSAATSYSLAGTAARHALPLLAAAATAGQSTTGCPFSRMAPVALLNARIPGFLATGGRNDLQTVARAVRCSAAR